ncbi:MAG: hypothetical protein ABIG28_01535 [archaeon]
MAFPAWLIVAAILVVALTIMFRTMNQVYLLSLLKKHFFWIFAVLLLTFFAISLVTLNAEHNFDFTSSEGIIKIGKVYLNWFVNVGKNIGKVTGYVTQQDWFSTTNSTSP